ncbi:Uncharacterized protein TPAR_08439 [Tolypocladium paradoxum]|uniref:Uncharacterized protein n=1 Tax=Tolypocladium paradoxum TaxID=94208 RepID=A0A2S4KMD1_9HYPO|nr:Uncharacterized protein TPAR_08439 [Tolypocladium paradoxum]
MNLHLYSRAAMGLVRSCPPDGDDQFGPRIDVACRSLDFTLLFEDAFFVALPAAVFLLLLPWRLWSLCKSPVKVTSYRLATWKLALLAVLFILHVLFLVLRLRTANLYTRLSVASGVLAVVAVPAAGVLSLLADQRSPRPSDILVLYFSASTLLALPRLRSLWLVDTDNAIRAIWTVIFIVTMLVVFVESLRKTRILQPPYKCIATEQTTSFWSRGFFVWVLPFFRIGYSKDLDLEDVPRVSEELEERATWTKLERSWRSTHGRHRLLRATFIANLRPFLSAVAPRLALSAFTFCQPFLIESSVSYLSTPEDRDHSQYGQALVGAFVLVYLGIAVSRALYWRQTYRMTARIRAGLVSKVYRHTTTLRAVDVKDSAAVTLMGTDVERIVESLKLVHEIWASIPEVGVAVWLLARQISVASVVPLIICLASVAGASRIAAYFGPAQKAWVGRVQTRVAVTASMLGDMKAVKMLGLSEVLRNVVSKLRTVELRTSERFRTLRTWQILIGKHPDHPRHQCHEQDIDNPPVGNAPAVLAPFATFVTYAVIAKVNKDETLLSAQAFASLSLINLATNPLTMFCQALPTCMQAVACFGRIEAYCSKKPAEPPLSCPSTPPQDSPDRSLEMRRVEPRFVPGKELISFTGADISWSEETPEVVLHNLNLTIRSGFTAIIGPVASGKSTLLATLLGETTLTRGFMTKGLSGVAFCPQTPWIVNDTIRRNIIGDSVFDEKWYNFSVDCCSLRGDLARLPQADQSNVGSNGASLSGGQRQRVALARAVYSRLPIVVMDDVTSGLDNRTARAIATRLFSKDGHFRKAGISVILATHNRKHATSRPWSVWLSSPDTEKLLSQMDSIAILDGGRLADYGSYDEVLSRSAALIEQAEVAEDLSPRSSNDIANTNEQPITESAPHAEDAGGMPLDVPTSARRSGSWSVYTYYARSAGAASVFFWALFTVIGAVATNYTALWIQEWTKSNEEEPNDNLGLHLGVYALLVVLSTAGAAGECWVFFIRIINNTALQLHSDLLEATLGAPFDFFQRTDTGTITNRFSQDMDLIDMTLPTQAIQFTTGATSCAVQLIIICILGKYLAATIPALGGGLFVVQRYYLRTSRQVRLMDIEAKAPIYKHFIETVQGVASIRAFGWGPAFHEHNSEILNQSQKPFYMLACVQQWLALVLDLIVGALAVIIIAMATSLTGSISAAGLGVSLVLVLQFNVLLIQSVQAWTKLETSIGAVARVQQFVQDTPSEPNGALPPSADWPSRGAIQFHNLAASYGPHSAPVLNNVSLSVMPGEKVAICGTSGSGKSSLIMATLLMMELREGHITIDDVDISTLQGAALRSRINVIPQETFFMPGSVRFNIDAQDGSSDAAMTTCLEKVGLWPKICSSGGLDTDLAASEWSHGERQLLCLARAMLVPSKVLILDEATSSVDEQTEATMQGVIDAEFRGRTIISVLHRFRYIHHFDRVAVLRHGQLVECDKPERLLGRQSAFGELYRAHGVQQ